MSKTAFANLIITKLKDAIGSDGSLYTEQTPAKAQKVIAEAITEYLIANTTITISYAGVLTSGTGADSVVQDTMKITGTCDTIGKPSDYQSWVNKLQSVIASSFSVVSPGTNGVEVAFLPFNPTMGVLQISQKELNDTFQNNINNPLQSVWEFICGQILDWLTSTTGKNPMATSLSATRTGISAGTASLMSISIS